MTNISKIAELTNSSHINTTYLMGFNDTPGRKILKISNFIVYPKFDVASLQGVFFRAVIEYDMAPS